jgi:UDP-2-acetamido-3-amino-2,3-dideoxy-glucuronate N-acetyltransferase
MPIDPGTELAADVVIHHRDLVNLYGCRIGAQTRIGPFVEIQKNATVGARCKISSHSFICEGVSIEDEVFIGHGVMFTNDRHPRATNDRGEVMRDDEWLVLPTTVRRGASIGSNASILAGVIIGERALVAAGAVVTHNVAAGAIVAGVPARVIGRVDEHSPLGPVSG